MRTLSLLRPAVMGLMTVAALFGEEAVASAEEIYKATLIAPRGIRADKTAELTLTVTQFATEEDSEKLQKEYDKKGSEGLLDAIRQQDRGVARIRGGMTCRIHWVRVFEGKGGSKVIIVTEKPLIFPEDNPDLRSTGSFGFIQIDFAPNGAGRGTMAEVVDVGLEEDGALQIQAYNATAIKMKDVRREQQ
jgi:hypothetical protein